MVRCPECRTAVAKLARHLRRVHLIGIDAKFAVPTKKGLECPKCALVVMDLSTHLRSVHGIGNSGAKAQSAAPERTGLCKCPRCGVRVKAEKLKRHIRNVHKFVKTKVGKRRGGEIVWTEETKQRGFQTDAEQRRLDATREYAQKFRDHGQFGSHPSHDGFDDESNP